MKPNIPENPRNRKKDKKKKGRPRYFNKKIYLKRFSVERTFGWEDAYRSLVIRYDRKSSNYKGKKLLAYTLINLRYFWLIRNIGDHTEYRVSNVIPTDPE